jgi:hypothetical protein
MPKSTTNIHFDAVVSIPRSSPVSLPADESADGAAAFVQPDPRISRIVEPNNPLLTRACDTRVDEKGSSAGTAVAGGVAFVTTLMGTVGCAGQDGLAIGAIALALGLAAAGAWFGTLLRLDRLAGWLGGDGDLTTIQGALPDESRDPRQLADIQAAVFDACDSVSGENIGTHIEKSDWEGIREALLDEGRDPKELACIQARVLDAFGKIPAHVRTRICKAVAMANGDPTHAVTAIDRILRTNKQLEDIMLTLADIMLAYRERPNEIAGTYIAKVLIHIELKKKQSVKDPMLALAVALTSDPEVCKILVALLAIRVKLGLAQTDEDLKNAIEWLRQKTFGGQDVCESSRLPLLVVIQGVDIGTQGFARAKRRLGKSAEDH